MRFYSARLYDELKTFVWKGSKAQAQKGKHDDLVISTAIGVWLFDASPVYNSQTQDVNKAILDGFAMNQQELPTRDAPWDPRAHNPFKHYMQQHPHRPTDAMHKSGSLDEMDYSWVLSD